MLASEYPCSKYKDNIKRQNNNMATNQRNIGKFIIKSFWSKRSNSLANTHSHLYPRESLDYFYSTKTKSECLQLKDIALRCIILKFGVIIDQYYVNEQENSKKKRFKYLKKLYSKMLFEILSFLELGKMPDSYIHFLINPYIEELNLSLYCFENTTALLRALENVGDKIISLNLSGRQLKTHKAVELISLLPNLKTIHIDFMKSKNSLLGSICQQCPKIKSISVSHTQWVTDRSLHFLCTLSEADELEINPNIESLDVTGTQITIDGIMFALRYFPSLKNLQHRHVAEALHLLHYQHLLRGTLQTLPKYKLEEIYIYSDVEILDVLQICDMLCPNITCLYVNKISSSLEIDLCLSFQSLKEAQLIFDIDQNLNCPTTFFDLQKHHLKLLHIASARFSVEALCQCQKLQHLNLTQPVFENLDKALKSFHTFPYLTNLEITNMDLSDDNVLDCVLYILSSCPILYKLTLQSVLSFPDHAMDSILNCDFVTNLRELDVSFSRIGISSVTKALASIPKLKRLVIERCGILELNYLEILDVFSSTVEIIWT